MNNWILFVVIATLLDSSRIFVDNYSSDVYFRGRGAVSQKLVYGYALIIIPIILSAFLKFDFPPEYAWNYFLFFVTGLLSGLAGIPYFKALELDDSTNIGIFTQLAPILYLILGWIFLDEHFSPFQLLAFVFIIIAPLIIVMTTKKRSRKIKIQAIIYALFYVFIAVIGNLIFVKENVPEINFLIEIVFVLLGKGVSDLIIVYTRHRWVKRFKVILKESHGKVLRPLILNSIIGFIKDIFYRLALITAPTVAIASAASDSAEPIVIFFLGILFTLLWPKFGREKLDRKTILVHLVATVFVVIGIVLLQI